MSDTQASLKEESPEPDLHQKLANFQQKFKTEGQRKPVKTSAIPKLSRPPLPKKPANIQQQNLKPEGQRQPVQTSAISKLSGTQEFLKHGGQRQSVQTAPLFMNNELNILIGYMDKRFSHIDKRFSHIDKNFKEIREDVNALTETIIRSQLLNFYSKNYCQSFIFTKFSQTATYLTSILNESSQHLLARCFQCESLYEYLLTTFTSEELATKNIMLHMGEQANGKISNMAEIIKKTIIKDENLSESMQDQKKRELGDMFNQTIEAEIKKVKATDQWEINISGSLRIVEHGDQFWVDYDVAEIKKRISPYQLIKALKQLLRVCFIMSDIIKLLLKDKIVRFSCGMTIYYVNIDKDFLDMMAQTQHFEFTEDNNKYELYMKRCII